MSRETIFKKALDALPRLCMLRNAIYKAQHTMSLQELQQTIIMIASWISMNESSFWLEFHDTIIGLAKPKSPEAIALRQAKIDELHALAMEIHNLNRKTPKVKSVFSELCKTVDSPPQPVPES
jgi:hypothetical protein